MNTTKPTPLYLALLIATPAFAQETNTDLAAAEEVIVTGFRQSVAEALDTKRDSANNVEAIVAEDLGKMPDLNLAESLQRSPGVAITREGGEGRNITVRGLGPEYTRVTLNGMEVPASAGGTDASGGTNRGRPFDFNVFGAELFSKIIINKSAIAHVEEGGLASTVELFSHNPLDTPGLVLTGSVQGDYNINTDDLGPRITGLYSQTFLDDKVGVLAAFNYATREVRQDGFGTVRWTSPSENGDREFLEPAGGTIVNGTLASGVNSINDLFFPRLPRMDSFNADKERTGIALGVEAEPIETLKLGLNYLNSKFDQDTTSFNYFAQFRNEFDSITANVVDVSNNGVYAVGGEFEGVTPRSESRVQYGSSDFEQIVADFEYDFSSTLRLTGMIGKADVSYIEDYRRYNFDAISPQAFSFRLTDGENLAEMSYGESFDINDPSQYSYVNARIQRDDIEREYTTMKLDLTWDFDPQGSNIKVGFIANDRNITSDFYQSGPSGAPTLTEANTNTVGELYGDFGDSIGAPAGMPTSWLVADFGQLYIDLGSPAAIYLPTNSNTYDVSEKTTGIYSEVNWYVGDFLANAGLRYVETKVTAGDYTEVGDELIYGEESDSYDNVLPAFNLTYNLSEDLRARLSWSENISRPDPSNLSGATTVAPLSGTVSTSNPAIKPELAKSLDLSLEWYFAEDSYVGLTFFKKDITDAISSESDEPGFLTPELRAIVETYPEYGSSPNPSAEPLDSDNWVVSYQINSDEVTSIDGWEIGYQQVFDYGIGVLANFTYVDSGSTVIDGLSEKTTNLGVFWENDEFSARLMMNSRDDYVTREPGREGNLEEMTTGPTRFDVSTQWHVTEEMTLSLDVINLTDEKERLYVTGPDGRQDLVREYNTTGTELVFGVRARF